MIYHILIPATLDIKYVDLSLPVRCGCKDIPCSFPLRKGDTWVARIEIDTGKIKDWPPSFRHSLCIEVDNGARFTLIDAEGSEVGAIEGDIPQNLIPNKHGDYVQFEIDTNGVIANWPRRPDLSDFFEDAP